MLQLGFRTNCLLDPGVNEPMCGSRFSLQKDKEIEKCLDTLAHRPEGGGNS
jgi:hypothetical protein